MDAAAEQTPAAVVPGSTYRIQLHAGFPFAAASAIVPYLEQLGITHVYCSPYLQAVPGSNHGYDVIDHARVNSELGGAAAHAEFSSTVRNHGLAQVLDVVPNHMSIASRENTWWWDVLKHGRRSRYADHFDVDWDSPEAKLRDKVLVPILGDHYGRVLARGELRVEAEEAGLVLRYFEHALPIDPETVAIGDSEQAVQRLNTDAEALHVLLERQHFRLASWRTAVRELDYRRFFDVNSLAALRMEDEAVFLETHGMILRWLAVGVLDGVRIDHPDGLRDPAQYCRRVREAAPWSWVVVEKILAPGEQLPADWPVAGTTGYEFLNGLTQLYVNCAAEESMTRFYQDFTGVTEDFGEIAYVRKKLVLQDLLASDLRRLTDGFVRVCERNRDYRDFTRHDLWHVLSEYIACLRVYRTYLVAGEPVSATDRGHIEVAMADAKGRRPELDPELFDFLAGLLLQVHTGQDEAELVARIQQTSGAVTAKGVEDTAFYVYNRLLALNEVGGSPGTFGVGLDDFHAAAARTAASHPLTMLALSTHDTKRSEDVRARLTLLSEIPDEWESTIRRWSELNEPRRREDLPDRNTEYLLYQTLVGAYPIETDRVLAYMEKAVREAKTYTAWTAIDGDYEKVLREFIAGTLADARFRGELDAFASRLTEAGRINSLAWKLITLTAPGVPDIYQGTETWDLSLVDPDNRRPVDYEALARGLGELVGNASQLAAEAWRRADEGLPKLLVVQRALQLRRRLPAAFGPAGGYLPLRARGSRSDHVVAFCRGDAVVTVAPRLVLKLGSDWRETSLNLPAGSWRDVLTDRELAGGENRVAGLLSGFPVALLERS